MTKILNLLLLVVATIQAAWAVPLGNQLEGPQITFKVGGEEHNFVEDQPRLHFTQITEVCKTGVWVLYSNEDYVMLPGWNTIEVLYQVESICRDVSSPTVRSARLAGLRSNYSSPSVTFYGAGSMTGEALSFEGELPQINFEILSLLTIYTEVELFQESNFGGESFCVVPEQCLDGVCWLFSWNANEIPWNVYAAQSARSGCSSKATRASRVPSKGNGFATFNV